MWISTMVEGYMLEIYVIFFEPGLDNLGYMLWIIVLLEIKLTLWQKVKIAYVFMCQI